MKRSNVNMAVATLAAFGMLATACGGDDDEDAGGEETAESSIEKRAIDEGTTDDGAIEGGLFDDEDAEGRVTDVAPPPPDPTDGDAEGDLVPTATVPASASIDEEASAAADESGDASRTAGGPAATNAPSSASDGLFPGDESTPGSVPSRFDDNTFEDYGYREFVEADTDPRSTFALDVDTGSFTVARRWLQEDALPPVDSVRPEEYVNAFRYDYRSPRRGLEISVDGGPSPFDDDNYLLRVGVQGERVDDDERSPSALTFVIDTSGSMDRDDRLGLVKRSLGVLVDELDNSDTVAIVTYDDDAGVVLPPTAVAERDLILDAIDELQPGGSTNLESGLRTGYGLAAEAFRHGGINRVVLASDGVANVGLTDPTALAEMIAGDAGRGIDLVTVGFGMGNYNDVTMEQLADRGNGFYAYVDTDDEAERLFRDELTSTLLTIAKNAKIQVEFDADHVAAYRLIGFENRGVRDSDFRNDTVDAGELGADHQVTAIYEIELARGVDLDDGVELAEVFLRWEDPETGEVSEIADDVRVTDIESEWRRTADDFQLATVAATFAELLRDNPFAVDVDIDDLADEAEGLADRYDDQRVDQLAEMISAAARLG
jgi:Ca-activated chloride channel family protein